jgi:hypothetical protein
MPTLATMVDAWSAAAAFEREALEEIATNKDITQQTKKASIDIHLNRAGQFEWRAAVTQDFALLGEYSPAEQAAA